jgi:hypothetical protein
MAGGTFLRIDDSEIKRRLRGLDPSRYASKLDAVTGKIVAKYGAEAKSRVTGVFNRGNVIYGMHKKSSKKYANTTSLKVRSGYISENYIARWLDEGTDERWIGGRRKKRGKPSQYRGKMVRSRGVFRQVIAGLEDEILKDYGEMLIGELIDVWNKS